MFSLEELADSPVAVLGGGAVGKTCGADCALAGNRVRICDLEPYASTTLRDLKKTGITLTGDPKNKYGFDRLGKAHFELVTSSVKDAVAGCKLIIIAIPSIAHELFFEQLIPELEDGMIIHIIPDNYGSLRLRKKMRELGCTKRVIIGGWSSAPYGTRVETEGGVMDSRVSLVYRAITLRGAALPTSDSSDFLASSQLLGCFDSITQGDGPTEGDTVMDIGFSNVNPVLHCPGTLLGVGTMENWGRIYGGNDHYSYSIYSHAYCPSVAEVQYAFYQEEVELARAMGVSVQPFEKKNFMSRTSILGPEYMGDDCIVPFEEQWPTGFGTGPFDIHNRYITEDIPVGCHIYHELGKRYGVATPVIDAMIVLAGIMTHTDYFACGMTLEDLGIAQLSDEELLRYLHTGAYVEKA